jgi:O-antigen ligase
MNINKILLFINLFFLQAYLFRFSLWSYPTNLQEILMFLQIVVFVGTTPLKQTFLALRRHFVLLTFVLLTLISLIFVPIENQLDLIRHGKFLFFALVLSFIFIETFKTTEERHLAMKVMGGGAVVFGLFSLIYNLLGQNVAHDNRLLGPLDSAVYMAFYLTPFFIYFCIRGLENLKDKFSIFCSIVLAILILGTKSMGAVGGILAVMMFYFFKRQQLGIFKYKLTKILAGFFVILGLVAIFYMKILPAIQTNYSSLDERGEIWETSVEMLKNPRTLAFGVGFGQFQYQYENLVKSVLVRNPLSYIVLQPHNIFLLFLMQYGVLGLIFILSIIFVLIKNLLYFNGKPSFQNICGFMLLYFFVHGMIDTPFFKNDLMIIFILLISLSWEGFSLKTKSSK